MAFYLTFALFVVAMVVLAFFVVRFSARIMREQRESGGKSFRERTYERAQERARRRTGGRLTGGADEEGGRLA